MSSIFFSSRRRHTRYWRDWSSDVCSSDLASISGALSVGLLLIELYRASTSTVRPGIEVIAGQRVLTSAVDVGLGWVLGAVALGLTVLAGALAVAAWGRTVMEDAGSLDPARPALAGAAVLLGVGAVLCLVLPAAGGQIGRA